MKLRNALRRPPRGKFAESHWIAIISRWRAHSRVSIEEERRQWHQLFDLECSYKYKPGNNCYVYESLYLLLFFYRFNLIFSEHINECITDVWRFDKEIWATIVENTRSHSLRSVIVEWLIQRTIINLAMIHARFQRKNPMRYTFAVLSLWYTRGVIAAPNPHCYHGYFVSTVSPQLLFHALRRNTLMRTDVVTCYYIPITWA